MTETIAILLSGGVFVVVTILGWGGVLWQRNKLSGRNNGTSAEHMKNIDELLSNLPCQDNKYMVEWGMIRQSLEDGQLRFTRLEETIRDSQKALEDRMANMEDAIRLRKIL